MRSGGQRRLPADRETVELGRLFGCAEAGSTPRCRSRAFPSMAPVCAGGAVINIAATPVSTSICSPQGRRRLAIESEARRPRPDQSGSIGLPRELDEGEVAARVRSGQPDMHALGAEHVAAPAFRSARRRPAAADSCPACPRLLPIAPPRPKPTPTMAMLRGASLGRAAARMLQASHPRHRKHRHRLGLEARARPAR